MRMHVLKVQNSLLRDLSSTIICVHAFSLRVSLCLRMVVVGGSPCTRHVSPGEGATSERRSATTSIRKTRMMIKRSSGRTRSCELTRRPLRPCSRAISHARSRTTVGLCIRRRVYTSQQNKISREINKTLETSKISREIKENPDTLQQNKVLRVIKKNVGTLQRNKISRKIKENPSISVAEVEVPKIRLQVENTHDQHVAYTGFGEAQNRQED